ncbi:MAG: acyltransferase [Muribaculum sp.]|nr:acyltransferase [Muribaculum sp.]
MMNFYSMSFRILRKIKLLSQHFLDKPITTLILIGNKVKFSNFSTKGIPLIRVYDNGEIELGASFKMNNGYYGNPIGQFEKCTFVVGSNAKLLIGEDTGISQCALLAHANLTIGNRVKIGGGTAIYTTDFHSLDPVIRGGKTDLKNRKCLPVTIGDDVFIGARCIILKGITIGDKSIIGAGSVVTKSIPPNQIWAGNPAKFIRNI